MSDLSLDDLLEAIASLDPDQRRELFSRLGVMPIAPAGRQLRLLNEFAANTLEGAPDYVLMFDGGSQGNPGRGYGSYALMNVEPHAIKRLNFGDGMTNNEAEYATLMHALDDLQGRIERDSRLPEEFSIEVQGDSALVLKQVSGEWKAKDPDMRRLRDSVRRSLGRFKANRLTALPREKIVEVFGH